MPDNNPFQPPTSEVHDPLVPLPPSPPAVRIAGYLVLLSFLLGLVTLLPSIRPLREGEADVPIWATGLVIAVFGAVTLWLVLQTQRGRNWARWSLLAYLILGWVLVAPDLQGDFSLAPLAGIINVVCIALEALAAVQLFVGAGGRWFGEVAASGSR